MKIIFLGTPDFALPSLDVVNDHFDLIAVITAPDKRGGRGHGWIESPVKKWALEHNKKLLQPKNLKSPKFLNNLKKLGADIFVVVAFRMLPKEVWNMPELGTINLHGSLLPKYRGAAPIQRAILNGENDTGLTTFILKEEIDTGDILLQKKIHIEPNENFGSLYEKMKREGSHLLKETLDKMISKSIQPTKQLNELASPAPKISPKDLEINWHQPVENVHNQIRAFSPFPGAWTTYEHKIFKIFSASRLMIQPVEPPGNWVIENRKSLKIACLDGYIQVLSIQPPSKKCMDVVAFLNGFQQ
ncbi:MAG: methionyl-tRNA formyltransferase [Saprospiraceae bacterium]|nr:methionyl-tRNA formyltransferase [Candidatus Vicinibacter affinis]MBP6172168.1 methionyl-tRNA formyltransferase [Saprospiraceae bacterium]MBK6822866.1 methionyl-tRNA formyltransferase [Candidatus Vicinibacter affinis]MBK7304964.1 methionyl-tRNA formyltransferase [Candidatus Vicinibacter affinis]MBK7694729.1 methionyl-tRNA formyltransferase [Candidatus Vicinibacter affinis]